MDTELPIIPFPESVNRLPGRFCLDGSTCIDPASGEDAAAMLRSLLAPAIGYPFPTRLAERNMICLRVDPGLATLGPEGYRLAVTPEAITLEAHSSAGLFYDAQSLRQLLPAAIEWREEESSAAWDIPCLEVADRPRFSWRGFMLDEGRHFHGKQAVLQLLDLMALLKLNIFHWHLTEDQGWRIEIRKYPRLTQVGAQRPGTKRSFTARRHDGIPHAGFYTQEEIREIVAYAAARHITVVPEIELPGHSMAALAAYPELSCTGGPFQVQTGFGIFPDILCAGKDETLDFLQNVLAEVLDLFPSPYIHIGGDEAPMTRWKSCPRCQERIRRERLDGEHSLQVWLANRIAAWLAERGRQAIAWNQALGPGLDPGVIVQFWAGGRRDLVRDIRDKHRRVVMSTFLDTYLDHGYSLMPLSRAYGYEPAPKELKGALEDCILGPEFSLWTEWVPDQRRLDFQTWPRLCALSEIGWTQKGQKDYRSFLRRMEPFLKHLEQQGVHYAPQTTWDPPFWKRLFSIFTIATPQHGVAPD